jgi:hypothetical protein
MNMGSIQCAWHSFRVCYKRNTSTVLSGAGTWFVWTCVDNTHFDTWFDWWLLNTSKEIDHDVRESLRSLHLARLNRRKLKTLDLECSSPARTNGTWKCFSSWTPRGFRSAFDSTKSEHELDKGVKQARSKQDLSLGVLVIRSLVMFAFGFQWRTRYCVAGLLSTYVVKCSSSTKTQKDLRTSLNSKPSKKPQNDNALTYGSFHRSSCVRFPGSLANELMRYASLRGVRLPYFPLFRLSAQLLLQWLFWAEESRTSRSSRTTGCWIEPSVAVGVALNSDPRSFRCRCMPVSVLLARRQRVPA